MADEDLDAEVDEAPEPDGEVDEPIDAAPAPDRDRDLLRGKGPSSPLRKRLDEIRRAVKEGFDNQSDRADAQDDYWDCYNCTLNSNQFYSGNSEIYVPIVRDAVNARNTRFVGQLFPQSGRYVEAVNEDGSGADQLVALLDHYVRSAKFKTNIAKPLCRNGDIEGQYNLCVDWTEIRRTLVSRVSKPPTDPVTGVAGPGEDIDDRREEDILEGYPGFEVLHDCDVLITPGVGVDSVDEALMVGGSITIVRRWTKTKIEAMEEVGAIRKAEARDLCDNMGKVTQTDKNQEKSLAEHVGIQAKGKMAVVWETWACLKLNDKGDYSEDGTLRLCRIFFGPDDVVLGCKRNPYWNDRCPLLSVPVEKVAGVPKGESLIAPIASLQYEANDAINQGADAAAYSALPIVTRDPEKSDGPLVLNLAAIWDAPPGSVQFMTFPDLTPRALTRVSAATSAIFQALGVNPAMLPQQTGKPGAKRNQAEIAMEQSVDLLTTAEAVSVMEEGIFTPAMAWTVDLDYQFRDNPLLVRMFGEMGHEAVMQEVAPLQNRNGFTFIWRGGDQARQNAMMMQQGTGWLNVLRGLAPQLQAEGKQLRLAPLVEAGTRNLFGPMLAGQIIVDMRDQLTLDPAMEVQMMLDGFETHPHPMDNDQQKIQVFQQALQQTGDPHGTIRVRLQMQLQQMQQKQQAIMLKRMQEQQQGQGPPQGRGPGAPQPGASSAGPRLIKSSPGAIHPDQMARAGAVTMPRKT